MGTIFLVEEAVPTVCAVMVKGDSLYLRDTKNVEVVLQDYSVQQSSLSLPSSKVHEALIPIGIPLPVRCK